MLDIRLIREKPAFVKERLATRGGGDEAKIDNVNAATCPITARPAAAEPRDLDKNKIDNDAARGAAGISQRLVRIQ